MKPETCTNMFFSPILFLVLIFVAGVWSLAQVQGRGGGVSSRGSARVFGVAGVCFVFLFVNELSLSFFVDLVRLEWNGRVCVLECRRESARVAAKLKRTVIRVWDTKIKKQ